MSTSTETATFADFADVQAELEDRALQSDEGEGRAAYPRTAAALARLGEEIARFVFGGSHG